MDEKIDGRLDEQEKINDGWMDIKIGGMDRKTQMDNKQMDGWMNRKKIYEKIDGWMNRNDRWMFGCIEKNRWMGGRKDKNRWMVGWMDIN